MKIISILSSATGRTAAYVDNSGIAKVRNFPVNATDEHIKTELSFADVANKPVTAKAKGKKK